MKVIFKYFYFIFLVFLFCCVKKTETSPKEKLVYSMEDLKCKCINPVPICYYDTVKTLLELKDIEGRFFLYPLKNNDDLIIMDNWESFIKKDINEEKDFFWWKIQAGRLNPCFLPKEIYNIKNLENKKIKFSCKVDYIPKPSSDRIGVVGFIGYWVQLTKLEILE